MSRPSPAASISCAHDGVGAAQHRQVGRGDRAEEADGQAGAGEGLALDDLVRQAERAADRAHFVLEEEAQRLDQLELHVVGQAADVVMRLDLLRGARVRGVALSITSG